MIEQLKNKKVTLGYGILITLILILIVLLILSLSSQSNLQTRINNLEGVLDNPISSTITQTTPSYPTATVVTDGYISPNQIIDNSGKTQVTTQVPPVVELPPIPYSPEDTDFKSSSPIIPFKLLDTIALMAKGQDLVILNCDVSQNYQVSSESNWSDIELTFYQSEAFMLSRPDSWKVFYKENAGFYDYGITGCFSNTAIDIALRGAQFKTYSEPDDSAFITQSERYSISVKRILGDQVIYSGNSGLKPNGYPSISQLEIIIYDTVNKQLMEGVVRPLNMYNSPDLENLYTVLEDFVDLWITKL